MNQLSVVCHSKVSYVIKGAPPIAADPGGFPDDGKRNGVYGMEMDVASEGPSRIPFKILSPNQIHISKRGGSLRGER